ncbi:Bug family tripartite tricarboxylate transporter substrate binding protein [Bordetella flabilis]|uniref:ABC transporter substrate-binding protein n=1 Tax=Bordetella flabilis TaxID=463014 RepID=A0A193GAR4_9BORD|nr:tripartite tricarboxylate transporter substrate binding protein [Bordetella flabilis]ANN76364.1 ABC transporter substrate-binding protein [Bordetella flabilis]
MIRKLIALSLALLAPLAAAQDFPTHPITIIVPVPPGGIVDLAARLTSEPLTSALGQSVVIDNRAGASGNIAYALVAAAPPDGYTLLASYSMYHVGNPSMFTGLRWSAESFKPVGMVAVAPHVVTVHPSLPVHNLKELVAYAKAHPGEINYASQGSGSVPHVGTEMFKQMTGTDMVHVPYKGSGPAIQDVLSGRVQLFVTTPPSVIGHVQTGRLRAIAVAGAARHPMIPDVPTAAEQGYPGFELDAWVALFAPANTPDAVVQKISAALETGLQKPEVIKTAEEAGVRVSYQNPAQLGETVSKDTAHWSQVIKSANITVN